MNAHPGDIYARSDARFAELRLLYPSLFRGPFISCDWPVGWHPLVREASAHAHEYAPHVRWSQIKEKYGQLKLYYSTSGIDPDARFRSRVQWAEAQSLRTCVLCGVYGEHSNGSPRARLVKFGGWWLTACASCELLITAHRKMRFWGGEE